ncbi:TetR/AcrR family transcriptional regulator [Pilimelia columellifera]|uniref:TetR/AcrR family transcriptional regulator n=1 Tax=Pilimelia columellifera subsp. columellifera TaxID=706583 RepID=A0ABN3NKI3_9ACTN
MQSPARRDLIADAAITVIAGHGLRGLTHRAVDAAAGLPAGSTSYYARTRAALIELVLSRLLALDLHDAAVADNRPPSLDGPDDVVALGVGYVLNAIGPQRSRALARFELALEATRRPELRATYDRMGAQLREMLTAVMAGVGSADPPRHAWALAAWLEGAVFEATAGAGGANPPDATELTASLGDVLRGLLATVTARH